MLQRERSINIGDGSERPKRRCEGRRLHYGAPQLREGSLGDVSKETVLLRQVGNRDSQLAGAFTISRGSD